MFKFKRDVCFVIYVDAMMYNMD